MDEINDILNVSIEQWGNPNSKFWNNKKNEDNI